MSETEVLVLGMALCHGFERSVLPVAGKPQTCQVTKKLKIRKVVRVQILISFTVSLRQERSNYCHEQSSSISLTFLNANKHLQLFRPRRATPQSGTGIVVPVLLMRNEPCCPGVLSLNYKKTVVTQCLYVTSLFHLLSLGREKC